MISNNKEDEENLPKVKKQGSPHSAKSKFDENEFSDTARSDGTPKAADKHKTKDLQQQNQSQKSPAELKNEKKKIFKEEDVLDIEEAQEKDAFDDIQNILEDNYLEIEQAVNH